MFNLTTRFALFGALAVAAVLASSHASAGTQMPPWKWQQLYGGTSSNATAAAAVVTEESTEDWVDSTPTGNGDGQDAPIYVENGSDFDGGLNGNTSPQAVPTPSAVLGGIAMMGLLAGRRRRQAQDA